MEDGNFVVYLNYCNGKILRLIFFNVIQFSYKLGSSVSHIYEITAKNPILDEALSFWYVKVPSDHPYKLFQIIDIEDFPFIEVVAERAEVVKD